MTHNPTDFIRAIRGAQLECLQKGSFYAVDAFFSCPDDDLKKAKEVVRLFYGTREDAYRFREYAWRCKQWLEEDGVGPVPVFKRFGKYRLLQSRLPKTLPEKIKLATALVREQDIASEEFEDFFGESDTPNIINQLCKLMKGDPFLRRGMKALGEERVSRWKYVVTQQQGLPLLQFVL